MVKIEFFKTGNGRDVITEFLDELPTKHRAKAVREILLLKEFGSALVEPHVKHLEDDLWELRIKFASDISRIFYFYPAQTEIVLLHGFVKKTNKTPKREIRTANKRKEEYKSRKRE